MVLLTDCDAPYFKKQKNNMAKWLTFMMSKCEYVHMVLKYRLTFTKQNHNVNVRYMEHIRGSWPTWWGHDYVCPN